MSNNQSSPPNLELLLDVQVQLSIELGSCQMRMRDVLQLNPGTVVKLDQAAQAPVDLYANHKRIARGEVVVADDCYGIKITELIGDRFVNSASSISGAPDMMGSFLRMGGALLLVLGIFLTGVWLYRNWQRLAMRNGTAPKLNVLEVKSLGQRQAIYVVGYQQQRLLVASSPAGVTLLSHLPESEETQTAPVTRLSFAEAFQHVLARKQS